MEFERAIEGMVAVYAIVLSLDLAFFTERVRQPERPNPLTTIPLLTAGISVPLLCAVDLVLQRLISCQPFDVIGMPRVMSGIGLVAFILSCIYAHWEQRDWRSRSA